MIKIRTKNNLLRVVSLMISVMILSVGLFGVNAFAADVNYNITTVNINPNDFESSGASYDESLCNYIAQELSKHAQYIDISGYNIDFSLASDLFAAVLHKNPQLFFVNPLRIGVGQSSNGNIRVFAPTYIYNAQDAAEKSAVMEENINKLISDIDKSWKAETKALVVHDRLIINCQYATEELSYGNDANPDIYTAYGALVNKSAVCQGYTLAYNYMLSKLGIDAYFITSNDMNHAWSMVKIDGKYYHIDVTWDDPTYDRLGQAYHRYFLKSDNAFMNDTSQMKHYNWKTDYKATSTLYDNSFWNDIITIIPYIDGNYYYIENKQPDRGNIFKFDGINKTSVDKIEERWSAGGGQSYTSNFAYLAVNNGRLYYNTPDKIYSVKSDGTDKKLEYTITSELSQKGDIYGLKLEDDGYLYISVASSPANEPTNYKTVELPLEFILGDVDLDGKLSIKDAAYIQLYIAELTSFTEEQKARADMDLDKSIGIKDVASIQLAAAGLKY